METETLAENFPMVRQSIFASNARIQSVTQEETSVESMIVYACMCAKNQVVRVGNHQKGSLQKHPHKRLHHLQQLLPAPHQPKRDVMSQGVLLLKLMETETLAEKCLMVRWNLFTSDARIQFVTQEEILVESMIMYACMCVENLSVASQHPDLPENQAVQGSKAVVTFRTWLKPNLTMVLLESKLMGARPKPLVITLSALTGFQVAHSSANTSAEEKPLIANFMIFIPFQ